MCVNELYIYTETTSVRYLLCTVVKKNINKINNKFRDFKEELEYIFEFLNVEFSIYTLCSFQNVWHSWS